MTQNLLRRGQQVVLELVTEERVHRNTFVVYRAQPEQTELVPLTEGDIVRYYTPNSSVQGYIIAAGRAYQFESKVLATFVAPEPSLVIATPQQLDPVQRRRFFRVRVFCPVILQPLPENRWDEGRGTKDGEGGEGEVFEVFGTDVNAGGIGVRVDVRKVPSASQWRVHQRFQLRFTLPAVSPKFPNGLFVEMVGEVVWLALSEGCLRAGIAFTNIDRTLQERIVAWCFAFQRRLMQLGLLSREG